MQFFSPQDIAKKFPGNPTPSQWTVIIPAAGRGSRLDYDKPKILYPIAGRTILDWLTALLEPLCDRLIFVLSPSGKPYIEPILKEEIPGKYTIAIQEEPKGMADAIYQGVPQVTTPFTLIIWGDQVGIHSDTLASVMRIQEHNAHTMMTLPIVERAEPYVHYQTDGKGRFVKVLERREGAVMPETGQSDCGLFAFNTQALQAAFQKQIDKGITLSEGTKEWNFLPMLSEFDEGGDSVAAVRLMSFEESIGVNDAKDAAKLESYLVKRKS